MKIQQISYNEYSRTSLFRTRLIRSPRYFEGRSKALGFTLPLYASPVISKPRCFELFFHFPWDFEIAGFDCSLVLDHSRLPLLDLKSIKVCKCKKVNSSLAFTQRQIRKYTTIEWLFLEASS